MFDKDQIAALVDEMANHPHTVRLLSPYSVDLRPTGFPVGAGGYRVLLERRAFALHAVLVSDPLAIGLRAAVVDGVANNPCRLDRLQADVAALGWTTSTQLAQGHFALEASSVSDGGDVDEQLPSGVATAVLISQFVLDQLVVTRQVGEMRPSVLRPIAEGTDDGVDPWLYDPNARDKATARHRALENWLIQSLREGGLEPLDPASEPYFDVAWRLADTLVVCEVKTTGTDPALQLRLGIGQVLHYKAQLEENGWRDVVPALLVERWPADKVWIRVVASARVVAFDPHMWLAVQSKIGSSATP